MGHASLARMAAGRNPNDDLIGTRRGPTILKDRNETHAQLSPIKGILLAPSWRSPIYKFNESGREIVIDVTTSVAPGLPPHQIIKHEFIPLLRRHERTRILDFGAGALRHTFPLLRAGFEVCAVEFETTFGRPTSHRALQRARKNANFTTLIWPHEFLRDKRRFDAAILAFVLQTMPRAEERPAALRAISDKLVRDGYLLYMARYGQITPHMKAHKVSDGYFTWPKRAQHSFYREFGTEETHAMMKRRKLQRLRTWSARGTEQVFLYGKPSGKWI
jgi:SAM-dependent methyltransferase